MAAGGRIYSSLGHRVCRRKAVKLAQALGAHLPQKLAAPRGRHDLAWSGLIRALATSTYPVAIEDPGVKDLFRRATFLDDDDVVYWYSFSNHYTKREENSTFLRKTLPNLSMLLYCSSTAVSASASRRKEECPPFASLCECNKNHYYEEGILLTKQRMNVGRCA